MGRESSHKPSGRLPLKPPRGPISASSHADGSADVHCVESPLPFAKVGRITPDLTIRIVLKTVDRPNDFVRNFGRRSIGEVVQHVDTDPRIRIAGHGEQPIPHRVELPLDIAGAQVLDGDPADLRVAVVGEADQFFDVRVRRTVRVVGLRNAPARAAARWVDIATGRRRPKWPRTAPRSCRPCPRA